MDRKQKQIFIQEVSELTILPFVMVIKCDGLDAGENHAMRQKIRSASSDGSSGMRVIKNSLMSKAFGGTPFEPLVANCKGPTAVVFGQDPVSITKAVFSFVDVVVGKVVVQSAVLDGRLLHVADLEILSKLPSLQQLHSTLVFVLQQNAIKLLRTLQEPAASLARLLARRAAGTES